MRKLNYENQNTISNLTMKHINITMKHLSEKGFTFLKGVRFIEPCKTELQKGYGETPFLFYKNYITQTS